MGPSIWTVDERPLLAPYVTQYRASDEDSRILLLENKVIPNFLAAFPPGQADSDEDEAGHEGVDLREAERRLKQKIHSWFIRKTPMNVSSTPRRKPRARGDPEVREVLKHYVEPYRVGTEQSRKILIATRVLPEFVRQFLPYGDVNKVSKEQRSYYKKYVRDWLTIEAYYRDEGEQDPEHGLHLRLDNVSESDGGESPPHSPTPSVRRKRVMSPAQDELPAAKRQKTYADTNTRVPVSSPSREVRPSPAELAHRPAPRPLTPTYESAAPLSPPQTPQRKVHSQQTRRHNPRYVVYSAPPSPEPGENPEPAAEAEAESELDEDSSTGLYSARYVVYSALPSPEPEKGSEPDVELEPQAGTDLRSKSPIYVRSRSSTPGPRQRTEQDVEDKDKDDEDQDEERVVPQEDEVIPQEPDVVMEDEEYSSEEEDLPEREKGRYFQGKLVAREQEEDQDDDLDDDEGEKQQPAAHALSKRPAATAPSVDPADSEEDSLSSDNDTPPARSVQLPRAPTSRQGMAAPKPPSPEAVLADAIVPLLRPHSITAVTNAVEKVMRAQRDTNAQARIILAKNDHYDKDNQQDQGDLAVTPTTRDNHTRQEFPTYKLVNPPSLIIQGHNDVQKSLKTVGNALDSKLQQILTQLEKMQTQLDNRGSQTNLLTKRVKELHEGLNDTRGRKSKSKPKKSRDSTTTVAGVTNATSPSTPRRQPTLVEAIVGRFRKSIGVQVTVTYYLVKLAGRPLEEAVWRSLQDFAQLPNSAIILAEFHAQAEAEGLNLSKSKDDYVYLRDAFLAGWCPDGTVHKRT